MVPQTWIIKCLKILKIADRVINFITKAMENQKMKLATGGQTLAEVKLQIGIFLGDSPTQFLSIIAMMPLN